MTDLQNDIEKYLKGELSPTEMHALEKKALDDPFLADALEGAESVGPEAFHDDLEDLREQLQNRIAPAERKTVHVFWTWTTRVAAGLLLLTIATYLLNVVVTRQSVLKQEQEPIVYLEGMAGKDTLNIYLPPAYERHSGSPGAFAMAGQPNQHAYLATRVSHTAERRSNELDVEVNLISPESLDSITNAGSSRAPRLALAYSQQAAKKPAGISVPPIDNSLEFKDKSATAPVLRPSASPVATDSVIAVPKVKGRVLFAEDGSAIPGVTITEMGTFRTTVTDSEGYFEMPVPGNGLSTLRLAYVGMQNQEIKVAPGVDVQAQMTSDVAALSEVVITDRNVAAKKEATVMEPPTPDGGRQAFNNYIAENLKYPDQALENNIEGRVTVEFTVQPSGQISDFKIVKGLGYGCDEEAIRLIKQGPKWIPARQTKEAVSEQVKVRLKFALPRKK